MTTKEFHLAFKIKLDKEDIIGYPSFTPEEIDFWLTQAVIRFVKQRYSGHDSYKTDGFQSSEKRDADLRNTLNCIEVRPKKINENEYVIERPDDYWFGINEDIYISSLDRRWPRSECAKHCDLFGRSCFNCKYGTPVSLLVDPIEATYNDVTTRKNDYLSEFNLNANNARPIRISYKDYIKLYTDGTYYIDNVSFTYIQRPTAFDIFNKPDEEYSYIPEQAHDEITSMAVLLALDNVSESQRLQSFSQITDSQE